MALLSARPNAKPPLIAVSASGDPEISLLSLLLLLALRKNFILLTTAGVALAAVLLALILPASYTATTTFMPPQQSSSASSALLAQLGNLGSLASLGGATASLKSPNEMYIALMKSETVEDAMVERYGLMREYGAKRVSDARKDFEKHVTIDGSGKDGLIHVSLGDHDAARAAEMANGYVAQYRKLTAGLAIGEAAQRRVFFEQQLQQARDNLARAEESLKQTEQSSGAIQIDSQTRALIESAAALRAQISTKEVQVQSMRTYAGDNNVDLIEAEQQLASMRAQLAKLSGGGDEASSGLMVSRKAIPQAEIDYIRELRDVRYNETIFEILARQYESAKLDEAREGALIQVVDVAKTPDRKSFPHLSLFLAGGILLGFAVSCAWVCCSEVFRFLSQLPEYGEQFSALRNALFFARRG